MALDSSLTNRLLKEGVVRDGHFVYRSGRHSSRLLDRDLLIADPTVASHFGYLIAKHYFRDHIETVATPSIWGSGLAQWVGYFLEPRAKVVEATVDERGIHIAPMLEPYVRGRRMLVVDNLVLTGDTMHSFLDYLHAEGAEIFGIATLWNAGEAVFNGIPLYALLNQIFPAYKPAECPACAEGLIPPTQVPY